MIKQSKLSKFCWALVYLLPLIFAAIAFWFDAPRFEGDDFFFSADAIFTYGFPFLKFDFFTSSVFVPSLLNFDCALFVDHYLGYLVFVSLFRIVWRVLVYLPDVIGKLIDRWSL